MAKWEDDVRKSLASKKAAAGFALTKQQQSLVQAQLEKESKIREHINTIKGNLERGLHLVRSLVAANVPNFRSSISLVVSLLLEGALDKGSFLVGPKAFETYLVCLTYL